MSSADVASRAAPLDANAHQARKHPHIIDEGEESPISLHQASLPPGPSTSARTPTRKLTNKLTETVKNVLSRSRSDSTLPPRIPTGVLLSLTVSNSGLSVVSRGRISSLSVVRRGSEADVTQWYEWVKEDTAVVAQTVEALRDHSHGMLFQKFTQYLYAVVPEAKLLYGVDGDAARLECFASFLSQIVAMSRRGITKEHCVMLQSLMRHHAALGIIPKYIQTAGDALVGALCELLPGQWGPTFQFSWRRIVDATVNAMCAAHGDVSAQSARLLARESTLSSLNTSNISTHSDGSGGVQRKFNSRVHMTLEYRLQTVDIDKISLGDVLRDPVIRPAFLVQMRGVVDERRLELLRDIDAAESAVERAKKAKDQDAERFAMAADHAVGVLVTKHITCPLNVDEGSNLSTNVQAKLSSDWLKGSLSRWQSLLKKARFEVDMSMDDNTWLGFKLYLQVVKYGARVKVDHEKARIKQGKIRVLVIGGGFAGLSIARELDKDKRVHVTLLDKKSKFEFSGALVKALTNPAVYHGISIPYERIVRNGTVFCGSIAEMGEKKAKILTCMKPESPKPGEKPGPGSDSANGETGEIPEIPKEVTTTSSYNTEEYLTVDFDYCVVTTGVQYPDALGRPALERPYHTRESDLWLRQESLHHAQAILVIGGGVVGVELACEIKAGFPGKHVILCQRNARLVMQLDPSCHKLIYAKMSDLGIEVALGSEITNVMTSLDGRKHVITRDGREWQVDLVYRCTGGIPQTGFMKAAFGDALTKEGYVLVDHTLQVMNHPSVFACGDCAQLQYPEAKLAIRASTQALTIIENLKRIAKDGSNARLMNHRPHLQWFRTIISMGPTQGIYYHGQYAAGTGTAQLGDFVARKFDFVHMVLRYLMRGETNPALDEWLKN